MRGVAGVLRTKIYVDNIDISIVHRRLNTEEADKDRQKISVEYSEALAKLLLI